MTLPAALFYHPMTAPSGWTLWLILPLCLMVAIVYKTIRAQELRTVPRQVTMLMLYIVVGLVALGSALWAFQAYWP